MERARVRTRQLPPLQRGFERSRLEDELAVPIRRQSLPAPQRPQGSAARQDQLPARTGGFSA